MDQQTLIDTILREAKRDYYNGKGRIFRKTFLKTYGVTEEHFMLAIKEMQKLWKGIQVNQSILNENIFFFHLADSQLSSE